MGAGLSLQGEGGGSLSSSRATLLLLTGVAFVASILCAQLLDGVPHVSDEVAYLQQAKLFASGARVGPAAASESMAMFPFIETREAFYGVFPPGWPALLSIGVLLGVPWLINPIIAAALPFLTWRLLSPHFKESTALLAAAAIAASPGVWILAGSHMSQTSVLAALLFAAGVATRPDERTGLLAAAGAACGYVILARPFDGVIFGGAILLFAAARNRSLNRLVALALPPMVACLLLLLDNQRITGSPLTFPVNAWFDHWVSDLPALPGCNALGFGEEIGCYETLGEHGHSPAKAAAIAAMSLQRFDRLLLGVPGASLLLLVGAWRLGRRSLLPIALSLLVVAAYALYWSPGLAYGARFWHPIYIAAPLLLAAALSGLPQRVAFGVVAGAALLGSTPLLKSLSSNYWCANGDLSAAMERIAPTNGVLFLRTEASAPSAWPELGVDEFLCDALTESTNGFHLNDPTGEGLTVRHALSSVEETEYYMSEIHPGEPAWLAVNPGLSGPLRLHELSDGEWRPLPLK